MLLIPAIDLKNGQCVRLRQGKMEEATVYSDDPATVAKRWADPRTTPPELLLWFHHLPWDYAMPSGRTLWAELIARYDRGVAAVAGVRARWAALQPDIDAARHAEVTAYLAQQEREARWWRDACIAYFQSVSGLPLPAGVRPPERSLDEYKRERFPYAPGKG